MRLILCSRFIMKNVLLTSELYTEIHFRVLIKLDQAEESEHITDWSDIWQNFDVVESSIRKKDKESPPDSLGPKTRRLSNPPKRKDCRRDWR